MNSPVRNLSQCERELLTQLQLISDECGEVVATQKWLSSATGYSERSVFRALASLARSGFIAKTSNGRTKRIVVSSECANGGGLLCFPSEKKWLEIARSVPDLSRCARKVFDTLACQADSDGVVYTVVANLQDRSGYGRRSVFRGLQELELCGAIVRESDGRVGLTVRIVDPREKKGKTGNSGEAGKSGKAEKNGKSGNAGNAGKAGNNLGESVIDTLNAQVRAVAAATASQNNAGELAQILEESGRELFGAIAARRTVISASQRLADTLSVAWMVMNEEAAALLEARSPASLWRVIVQRACARADGEFFNNGELSAVPLEERYDVDTACGVEGMGFDAKRKPSIDHEVLEHASIAWVVRVLVEGGVDETLARAGTLRVLQVIRDNRESYQQTAAAHDMWFLRMGISPEAARAWVNLVGGARGESDRLVGSLPANREKFVNRIVECVCA